MFWPAWHECNQVAEDLKETVGKDGELKSWFKTWSAGHSKASPWGPESMPAVQIVAALSVLLWIGAGIWGTFSVHQDAGREPGLPQIESASPLPETSRSTGELGTVAPLQTAAVPFAATSSEEPESIEQSPALPIDSTVAGGAGFTVQVASLQERSRAEALRARLQAYGFSAYLIEINIPESGRYYRVRVGPL